MTTPEHAEAIASELLHKPLPRRWAHSQGVAAAARGLASTLGKDAEVLIAAAWLHDIGYAPVLADEGTGFHPLDGARHLRDVLRTDGLLCRLVAHHSCALAGAAELGLADDLAAEFPAPPGDLADVLTFCDLTTGPDGQTMSVSERLAEIYARYGPDHPATRSMTRSAPELLAAADRTLARVRRGAEYL